MQSPGRSVGVRAPRLHPTGPRLLRHGAPHDSAWRLSSPRRFQADVSLVTMTPLHPIMGPLHPHGPSLAGGRGEPRGHRDIFMGDGASKTHGNSWEDRTFSGGGP